MPRPFQAAEIIQRERIKREVSQDLQHHLTNTLAAITTRRAAHAGDMLANTPLEFGRFYLRNPESALCCSAAALPRAGPRPPPVAEGPDLTSVSALQIGRLQPQAVDTWIAVVAVSKKQVELLSVSAASSGHRPRHRRSTSPACTERAAASAGRLTTDILLSGHQEIVDHVLDARRTAARV